MFPFFTIIIVASAALSWAVDGGIDKGYPIKEDLPGTVLGFVAGKEGQKEQQPRAKEHGEVLQKGEVSVYHGFRGFVLALWQVE